MHLSGDLVEHRSYQVLRVRRRPIWVSGLQAVY